MLHQFASVISEDDIVLTPIKATNRVLFGKVVGPYKFDPESELERKRNTRPVEWIRTDVSRGDISAPFRNTLGSLLTLFSLDQHAEEINRILDRQVLTGVDVTTSTTEIVQADLSDADHAANVEAAARERITDVLYSHFDSYEFEELVRSVLVAIGYRARGGGRRGPDGGVDIVATSDALGLDPERIKVQVKHKQGAASRPDVQRLVGTLAQHERGLFVSLGGFSNDARRMEDPRVSLMDGDAFIDLILEYYERLDTEMQARLPLRRVYLPAGA